MEVSRRQLVTLGAAGAAGVVELPALRIDAGGRHWNCGDGTPRTTLLADPFQLFRALSGRRSQAQIATFAWSTDPARHLEVFSTFPAPPHDIVEPPSSSR